MLLNIWSPVNFHIADNEIAWNKNKKVLIDKHYFHRHKLAAIGSGMLVYVGYKNIKAMQSIRLS